MSAPHTPPTPEALWDELLDEAGEALEEEAAGVSFEQAASELAAMGVDVDAELRKGEAFLAKLEGGADGATAAASPPSPASEPPDAGPPMRSILSEPPIRLSERRRPRPVVLLLVAATVSAAAVATYVALRPHEPGPVTPPPAPSPSAPAPPEVVTPPLVAEANELRAKAARACESGNGELCEVQLDRARQLDPAGDSAPDVTALRARAQQLIDQHRPDPNKR